jgi:anti-sigma factor RsiW
MRTLTCRATVAHLIDYIEGPLPPARRRALERHLRMCPRCVEFIAAYRRTPVIVRRATRTRLTARQHAELRGFVARLFARGRGARPPSRVRRK